MTALSSYLRHVIVAGLLLLVAKYKLPLEGADQAADALALLVIGTGTWAFVKFAPPGLLKYLGLGAIGIMAGSLSSCTPAQMAAARAIPIKACVLTDQGRICYSDVEGISAEIDATK